MATDDKQDEFGDGNNGTNGGGGWGHYIANRRAGAGVNLQVAIDRDNTGSSLDFINCPHIDVDPNIGLMLLMGLSDKLTVRKEEFTLTHPVDAIDPTAQTTLLADAIEAAHRPFDAEGKPRTPEDKMVIVLRFPNTHKHGKRFNHTHGVYNVGNCLEIPVVIDITPSGVKEWKAAALGFNEDANATKQSREQTGDTKAREFGFADARSMQNSRPLALNNFWLWWNEYRVESRKKMLDSRRREKGRLESDISVETRMKGELIARIEEPLPSKEDMEYAAGIVEITREELISLQNQRNEQDKIIERTTKLLHEGTLAAGQSALLHEERNAARKERRIINRNFGQTQNIYGMARDLTHEVIERKRESWRTIVAYKEEKIARLGDLLAQCNKQIEELENEKIEKHNYAETDRNPNLLTVKVLAADPQSFLHHVRDPEHPLNGAGRAVQRMYHQIYERATDGKPNGWLSDALSTKPESYYNKSTNRYFQMMRTQAAAAGKGYQDLESFANDPESSLGKAVTRLRENALSLEQRSANRRSQQEADTQQELPEEVRAMDLDYAYQTPAGSISTLQAAWNERTPAYVSPPKKPRPDKKKKPGEGHGGTGQGAAAGF